MQMLYRIISLVLLPFASYFGEKRLKLALKHVHIDTEIKGKLFYKVVFIS